MVQIPKPPTTTHETQILSLGNELVRTLSSVLDRIPGRPQRPQELARTLGINKDLSSRVMGALRKREALAAVHQLPGPVPLRQLVRAATKAGIDDQVANQARKAIDQFDNYVREEFGARSNLQGLLSTRVLDAREQLHSTSRQAVFRGISGIRGSEVDALMVTFLMYPSATNPERCDTSVLNAYFGIRRSRPNAQFAFTSLRVSRDEESEDEESHLLEEFCSPTPLPLESTRDGQLMRHRLNCQEFGKRHVTDLVTCEHYRSNHPQEPGSQVPRWFYATIDHPARLLLFEVLIHKDLWQGIEPELTVHDTAVRGEVVPQDPARQSDRLELLEGIESFASPASAPRCTGVPRYAEMIQHVAAVQGWSSDDFRSHRVQCQYPLYGSQYSMLFSSNASPSS